MPKHRYRILDGRVAYEVGKSLRVYAERLGCELLELNIQSGHVHVLIKVPLKVLISRLMGTLKGKTALQIVRQFWGVIAFTKLKLTNYKSVINVKNLVVS